MKTKIVLVLACWLLGIGAAAGQEESEFHLAAAKGGLNKPRLQPKAAPPRLPDALSKAFLENNKLLVHSYRWADGNAKPAAIVFRKDGTVENERAGLGGKAWELVDGATLRIGTVQYRLDRHQGILEGRVGKARDSYIYLDVPGEQASTPRLATSAVVGHIIHDGGGLRADQHVKVVTNFHLGFAVEGFAKQGDRVWQVHLHDLGPIEGVSGVFWVNARSGNVRPMVSMKND